jgi:hypothetical protein
VFIYHSCRIDSQCLRKTGRSILTSWIPDFIFIKITILSSSILVFKILNSRIHYLSFMNSRFQFTRSTVSNSWIHDFNLTNSQFQLHEFNVINSRFPLHKIVNSQSWNREFVKLKSGIHELKSWICENEISKSVFCIFQYISLSSFSFQ